MMSNVFVLTLVVLFQLSDFISATEVNYEKHVLFYCGYPSMVYRGNQWIVDFQQDCVKNESEIVSYCKRSFHDKNISSAEPSIEKVNIERLCDFEGKNCLGNVEIQAFKCLEPNSQSDALTLPKHCRFAHLGGNEVCKIYKNWVVDADEQCTKKPNWKLQSFGMLFQCSISGRGIDPMFFRGVEFVCCPNEKGEKEGTSTDMNEQKEYDRYSSNEVLENEDKEIIVYLETLKQLEKSEIESKDIRINEFKDGVNGLRYLWKSDPKLARLKEDTLISRFKMEYNALNVQFTFNKEQLLNFHDNRLRFIFTAKFAVGMVRLKEILQKTNKTELEIRDAMRYVLSLLMIRKNQIIHEKFTDQTIGSSMIGALDKDLKVVNRNVTDVYNKLDQVPQFKDSIKQYLLVYLENKFPTAKPGKTVEENEQVRKYNDVDEIISRYRYKPESKVDSDDDHIDVHYNLGLHDKDQNDNYAKNGRKIIFDRDTNEREFGDRTLLYTIVGSTVAAASLFLVFGTLVILYRHRPSLFQYSKPKYQDYPCKQMMHGFGIESSTVAKDVINGQPFNVYENPTYKVIHTPLTTSTGPDELDAAEYVAENLASPLILS